ncbi:hypothetical protein JCM18899A_07550 [Nocardioides sp. AN3]
MSHETLARRRAALEEEWARWSPSRFTGSGDAVQPAVRGDVIESWGRSVRTVDPLRASAPSAGEVHSRWADSPLHRPVSELSQQLQSVAHETGYIAAVADETGTILWSYGGPRIRRRAESINFAPGGRWGESHMGTNALSLALVTGRASTVFC